ncbi:hypothetical protein E4T56_gene16664 [Termitomyces sp. T112]|nr:hypothetical protein E4T56_gene16664 [Termitomyces sp. T112]
MRDKTWSASEPPENLPPPPRTTLQKSRQSSREDKSTLLTTLVPDTSAAPTLKLLPPTVIHHHFVHIRKQWNGGDYWNAGGRHDKNLGNPGPSPTLTTSQTPRLQLQIPTLFHQVQTSLFTRSWTPSTPIDLPSNPGSASIDCVAAYSFTSANLPYGLLPEPHQAHLISLQSNFSGLPQTCPDHIPPTIRTSHQCPECF